MASLRPTVALTNVNMEGMSRKDILDWVNTTIDGNYTKIEQLCSGVAYCQMMEQLFPNSVGLKKIKIAAKLEHEFLHNLRLFQTAFTRLKFDKSVPIQNLLKGRFQDNFEFLQWFKKFYDSTCSSNGKENIGNPSKLNSKSGSTTSLNSKESTSKTTTTKTTVISEERSPSPSSVQLLQERKDTMMKQTNIVENERNFYYKKLTAIEQLLDNSIAKDEDSDWCQNVLKIIYATSNNLDTESKPDSSPDM